MSATRFDRLVRFYPSSWRARYGAELTALMEDTYGNGRMPLRDRLGLAWGALREHLVEIGLGGRGDARGSVRAGSLLVLWGWGALVLGGAVFAKYAEGYGPALPKAQRLLPTVGFDAVFAGAITGLVIVGAAVLMVLPGFVSFLRDGGLPQVRRALVRTGALLAASVVYLGVIVIWAHHSRPQLLNGGFWPKGSVLIGLMAVVALTIASSVAAAGSAVRRLELPNLILRWEGLLAVGLSVVMGAILAGTIIWWSEMALHAPSFFTGTPAIHGDSAPPALLFAGMTMTGGALAGLAGSFRVCRSTAALR